MAIKNWFERVSKLFGEKGTQYYGDGGTIHASSDINVELDDQGRVVSVWFRCCPLQFTQTVVDTNRAQDMRAMYQRNDFAGLHGLEIKRRS